MMIAGSQRSPFFTMMLRMIRSFRIHAVRAHHTGRCPLTCWKYWSLIASVGSANRWFIDSKFDILPGSRPFAGIDTVEKG